MNKLKIKMQYDGETREFEFNISEFDPEHINQYFEHQYNMNFLGYIENELEAIFQQIDESDCYEFCHRQEEKKSQEWLDDHPSRPEPRNLNG